jgi:N-acetylmuramoyl-L-alanine amidase
VAQRVIRAALAALALVSAPAAAGERLAAPLIPEIGQALARMQGAPPAPAGEASATRAAPDAPAHAGSSAGPQGAGPRGAQARSAVAAAAPASGTAAAPAAPAAVAAAAPAVRAAASPATPAMMSDAAATARLRVALERAPAAVRWMALSRPDRLVVDLDGARAEDARQPGSGLVRGVRVARRSGGVVRVVIDLTQPARVTAIETGADLTIALAATTPADFATLVAAGAMAAPGGEPALLAGAAARLRPLIMLDPGHGGQDVGAISVWEGRFEKDLTLAMARAIAAELEASGRFRVALTRTDDRFLSLAERVAIARRAGADLFLSIHGDSAPNPMARGATVYTLSDVASDAMAARVAARENRADALAAIPLADEEPQAAAILYDLALRSATNASARFAQALTGALGARAPVTSNSHRFAGFRVLKTADMPAALLETGYLSNEEDARRLFSPEGQRAIAQAVLAALEAHFAPAPQLAAAR